MVRIILIQALYLSLSNNIHFYNPKKLSGPNDFNFPEKAIENKVKILKKITKNALDAKGRRFL